MTISNADNAFIWIWLPNSTTPIVAGKLTLIQNKYFFTYGQSYLANKNAIPFSPFELPLQKGTFEPKGLKTIHACLRDAGPDAWGRRLIEYKYPKLNPNELDFLLLSGSNRVGAFDFQTSAETYSPKQVTSSKLEDLKLFIDIAEGHEINKELALMLLNGTSIGGARPKCFIEYKNKQYIAKFSLSTDYYPLIKAEYIAMKLAEKVGLNVANVDFENALGRDIILIERFDRVKTQNHTHRISMLSGLSLFQFDEMEARYASYPELASIIRKSFHNATDNCHELFKRLVFNILIGNTDDHARNHSAFWDGKNLTLTPAYDLCPQARIGQEATQAMALNGSQGNMSTLINAVSISEHFLLSHTEATEIINYQISIFTETWPKLCTEVGLPKNEQNRLLGNTILSDFCLLGWK